MNTSTSRTTTHSDRDVKGRIFDIQRFRVHDGPGIRTAVFMQGCPLRCSWCHNPEGIGTKPLLSFQPRRCIGCGHCLRMCPNSAHVAVDSVHTLKRELCEVCGRCVEKCFSGALELVGREVTVGEALHAALRDRAFYETSGGGITLSGGEPMMQPAFAESLLRAARAEQLHTCVETCGFCDWGSLDRIRPLVDLFLYDYKETSDRLHREYTGVSNERIIENLCRLHERGADIVLRCPVIPGVNDREDHLAGIAALARELPRLRGVELIPYNPFGESKFARFGLNAEGSPRGTAPDEQVIDRWTKRLRSLGVSVLNPAGEGAG